MDIYGVLETEWARIAVTRTAARRLKRWAATAPSLGGWATPAALVSAIVADRQWGRPDPRLAALVEVAGDRLAARAVLQAILPGLAAEPVLHCRYHRPLAGPSDDPDDVVAELVAAAWEVIAERAGVSLADPENGLVRSAAERVRTRRRAEARIQARLTSLPATTEGGTAGLYDARSAAEEVVVSLVEAVRSRTVTARQAGLVYSVRVARIPGRAAGRRYGMTAGQVYYTVETAEAALRRASA